jgi:hypothetical protein
VALLLFLGTDAVNARPFRSSSDMTRPAPTPTADNLSPPLPLPILHQADATIDGTDGTGNSVFEDPEFEYLKAPIGGALTALALGSLAFTVKQKSKNDPFAQDAVVPSGPGGEVAPLPQQRLMSNWLKDAPLAFAKATDVYSGLRTGDDKEFRRLATTVGEGRVTLLDHRANLVAWAADLQDQELSDEVKARFRASIKDTIETVDSLIATPNPWTRGAKLAAQAILATPLSIVLPLFAAPIERQQAAVIIASYVKTTMLRTGAAMRGTTNDAVNTNLYNNRDFVNVAQSVLLSLHLYPSTRAIANHPAYSVGAAVFAAGFLAYKFYPEQVKALPGQARRGAQKLGHSVLGRPAPLTGQQAVRIGGATAGQISEAGSTFLQARSQDLLAARAGIEASTKNFKAHGKSLTDTFDWQVGQVLKGYYNLAKDMEALSGVQAGAAGVGAIADEDRTAKVVLAAFSALICAGVTAEFYKNKITLVDQGVDLLFNIYNGLNKALDPNVSWQGALDTFKAWTSLSTVMLPIQAANLAAGDPVSAGDTNMLIGAGILAAANITLAGPIGEAIKLALGGLIFAVKGPLAQLGEEEAAAAANVFVPPVRRAGSGAGSGEVETHELPPQLSAIANLELDTWGHDVLSTLGQQPDTQPGTSQTGGKSHQPTHGQTSEG